MLWEYLNFLAGFAVKCCSILMGQLISEFPINANALFHAIRNLNIALIESVLEEENSF